MKRNSVIGHNVAQLIRQRELRETVARHFQQKLHVTEPLVRRLELEATLKGHNGCVNCLEWNETGSILASASDDVQIILWDPFRHKKLHAFPSGHHGNVFTVKFLPKTNDRVLVTGAGDCLIRVHDITSNETTHSCSCHTARVKRIATAPSLPYMFWSASEDGTVMQFDLRTSHGCNGTVNNLLINLANHIGREAEAKCVAINPLREELLAVGANDPFIRVYDRRMIKLLNKDTRAPGKRAPGTEVPDNLVQGCVQYFVAGQLPSIQRFYRKNYRNLVSTYVTFGPNGRDLLANMGGEQVYIFDISNKRRQKKFEFSDVGLDDLKPDDDEGCERLTEDLMYLDVYAYGEECREFNRTNGFSFQTTPTQKGFTPPPRIETLKMIANAAYDAKQYTQAISLYNEAISQCPEYAFLYGNRAAAYMRRDWDGDMYAAIRDCHSALQLDPDYVKAHFRLARCLYELQWINEASKCLKAFKVKYPEHADQPACKALTKDVILSKGYLRDLEEASSGSSDDSSGPSLLPSTDHLSPQEKLWREGAYDYETRFCGHCNTTTDIKEANFFGSDGQFVVAGSDDGSFFIWDRRTTNIIRILRGDDSIVNCLQPHPTYCLLATSGIDPVVRLWTPKPEDGSKNDREVLNLYDAASANQKRMNADPFEVMLINMGYRIQAMRGGNSEPNNEGDHPTINCRPS